MNIKAINNSMPLNNTRNANISAGISKSKTNPYQSDSVSFKGLYQNMKLQHIPEERLQEITQEDFAILSFNEAQLVTLGFANYAKKVAKSEGKARPLVLYGSDANWSRFEKNYIIDLLQEQDVDVICLPHRNRLGILLMAAKKYNPDFILHFDKHEPKNPWGKDDYHLYFNFYTKDGEKINQKIAQDVSGYMKDIAKTRIYSIKLDSDAKMTQISDEERSLLTDEYFEVYKAAGCNFDTFLTLLRDKQSI